MRKEIEISGCVEIPVQMTMDEFSSIFLEFIEREGWSFGGGFNEFIDGRPIDNTTKTDTART